MSGTPGELCAETGEDTIFLVAFGGEVADFLLRGLESFGSGHQLDHLEHGHLLEVSDVPHGLELVEMTGVVHEVEHEIILHSDVEGLELLSGVTESADGGIDGVLRLHELFVLGVDGRNDSGGVDSLSVTFPVNFLLNMG